MESMRTSSSLLGVGPATAVACLCFVALLRVGFSGSVEGASTSDAGS